jgi:hypothetical protein
MDDKELIKRIMEEVKDEKLREELLCLVVEKNKKEDNTKEDDTKQEKEKPIDYVSKQAVLLGATETSAELGWWVGFIISLLLVIFGLVYFDKGGILLTLWGVLGVYVLWKGREEYEKLERERRSKEDIERKERKSWIIAVSIFLGPLFFIFLFGIFENLSRRSAEGFIPAVGILSLIVIAILIILFGGKPAKPITKDDTQTK